MLNITLAKKKENPTKILPDLCLCYPFIEIAGYAVLARTYLFPGGRDNAHNTIFI
jgi:hypothetical protein